MGNWPAWCVALEIKGMPPSVDYDSGGSAPVQFTNIKLPSVPAGMNAGSILLEWLEDSKAAASGFSFATGIRKPFPTGNTISLKVMDRGYSDEDNFDISRLCARDNADYLTGWRINRTRLSASATEFQIAGMVNQGIPLVDHVYWIRNEAVFVTGVVQVNECTHTVTVERGCFGSKARLHEVIPKLYVAGDDGTGEHLRLDSQPEFDSYQFDAVLRYIYIDRDGVPEIKWTRNGYVDGKPVPGVDHWVFKVTDLNKQMASHVVAADSEPVEISHHIRVNSTDDDSVVQGAHYNLAVKCSMFLSRYDTEKLFNTTVHQSDANVIDDTFGQDLVDALFFCSDISYKLLIESSGHKFLYHIASAEIVTITTPNGRTKKMAKLGLSLVSNADGSFIVSPGASISDKIVNLPPTDGVSGAIFNAGWQIHDGISIPDGIERPKVSLRIWMNCSPIKALLYFLLSVNGNGDNHADYDVLVGHRGLGLDPALVNLGTVAADPLDIPEDTIELLKLDQLIQATYNFRVNESDKFEDFASNIMRLHLLMMGTEPVTGAVAMRKWVRHYNSSVTVLDPISDGIKSVNYGQKMERLAAIKFYSGFEELELRPAHSRTMRLAGSNNNDLKSGLLQEVRIWKHGNQLSDQSLATGIVHDVIFAMLTILRDSPIIYSIETSVTDDDFPLVFGQTVEWTNDNVPTKDGTGRGVTEENYIVVAIDVNLAEGIQTLKVIRDPVNVLVAAFGLVSPALKVISFYGYTVGGASTDYEFIVENIAEGRTDLTAEIWNDIASNNGRVRLIDYAMHNPTSEQTETPGFRSYSATATGLQQKDDGRCVITLTVDDAYDDAGMSADDSMLSTDLYIAGTDYRVAEANKEAVIIGPIALEVYDNGNGAIYSRVAPGNDVPPFDGTHYQIT